MKRTRIICTVGPASDTSEILEQMYEQGMNLVRLNMSHGDDVFYKNVVKRLKELNSRQNAHVGLLWDLQGPEIRTGDISEPIPVKKGERVVLSSRPRSELGKMIVPVSYDDFAEGLSRGDMILIDNGTIKLKVLQVMGTEVRCEAMNKGTFTSRRHVNLQGKKTTMPSMSTKDKEDLRLGVKLGADWVALSYVRSPKDIRQLRSELKKHRSEVGIIAKIETPEAVESFEKIAAEADAIMVARGDLGAEMPFEEVPRLQAEMVEWCRRQGKPVIIATHMLESMMTTPQPTRAEATDVAFAVSQEADATMLSGETAAGEYPLESVASMKKIVLAAEESWLLADRHVRDVSGDLAEILFSAVSLANQVDADALVVFSRSGYTAQLLSHFRPEVPLYAFGTSPSVCRKLSLYWGVQALLLKACGTFATRMKKAVSVLRKRDVVKKGSKVVVVDHDGMSVHMLHLKR